jgi:hypothetical protein
MHGLFAGCVGACLSGMLWLLTWNQWIGVFVVGFVAGLFMLENWALEEEMKKSNEYVIDLEKQIVGLRSTISKMVLGSAAMEVERRRDKFRTGSSSNNCKKSRLDSRSSSF